MTYYNFIPARLVKGAQRWYVEFYQTHPILNERKRFREYMGMNRVKNLHEREKMAKAYITQLNNALLPYGYPYQEAKDMPERISVHDALALAMNIKSRTDRNKTILSYASVVRHFEGYLTEKGLMDIPLRDFGNREAVNYMDYLTVSKNIGARTYNNYRQFLTALWSELLDRGYIFENVFGKLKKLPTTEKERRMLDGHEAREILQYVHQNDKMLLLSILLLNYCFVRPGEQRQLKVHHIDLTNGVINIPGHISKNKKSEIVTIPTTIIPTLQQIGVESWYKNDYIFGKGVQPHPNIMCGTNTLNDRHNQILKKLKEMDRLRETKGISIYSWKDTGAMMLIRSGIDAYEIMRQMRHSDLTITQNYLKSLSHINTSIRDLAIDLPF